MTAQADQAKTIADLDSAITSASQLDSRDPDKRREMKHTIDGLLDERLRLMKLRDNAPDTPPLVIKTYIT